MNGKHALNGTYTFQLTDASCSDILHAGGKGASLARLVEAGLPVPDGFVVGTDAYRAFVWDNDLRSIIETAAAGVDGGDPGRLDAAAQVIGTAFARAEMPQEIREAVLAAYASLPGESPAVAVRSSATAEDLPDLSFAGQQETFLNVRGAQALLAAVQRCWSSLWTPRAISYRAQHDVLTEGVAMAVVVQLLVPADSAGILFTANPVSGRRDEALVNASWGLGEAVVGGQVTPDTLVVDDGTGTVITRETAHKTVMTVRTEEGSAERAVPEELRDRPVLDDAAAAELVALAVRIEALYGQPMDIEWAREDGRFAILQARPITALPEPSAPPPTRWDVPADRLYMRASAIELLPNPVTPLYGTVGLPALTRASERLVAWLLGGDPVESYETVNGYAYIGMDLQPRRLVGLAARTFLAVHRGFRGGGPRQWCAEERARYETVLAPWSDRAPEDLSATELLDGVREIADAGAEYLSRAMRRVMPMASMSESAFTGFYGRFVAREGDPPATTFLLGLESDPIRAELSLFDLARWSGERQALAVTLIETPTGEIIAHLDDPTPPGSAPEAEWREWRSRLRAHLDRHGAMLYDMDFARPLQADDPAPVIDTMRFYLKGEVGDPHARQRKLAGDREAATARIRARLGGGVRRRVFDKLLAWSLSAIPARETSQADIGLGWPLLRRLLRELGHRATLAGALAEPDDIYWLTADEVGAAAGRLDAGEEVLPSHDEVVRQRKALWRGRAQATPPVYLPKGKKFLGMDIQRFAPAAEDAAQDGGNTLTGVGANAGEVTARARVLHGPEDFGEMQPGEVLVAAITTPAWTPLFALAAAIVTDVGGVLSHGSIVAREYDIPAVLGTGVASKRIRDGQLLRVDGTAGTVEILEEVPAASPVALAEPVPEPV